MRGACCTRKRGFDWKMPVFSSRSQFWPALHTPQQFSQKAQGTDHLLCAFWTGGTTARSMDIGSTSCTTIFQVSDRTIRCTLDRSGGCWEDFVWICLSSVGWLGQYWYVQLFPHKIYAASCLFCAYSAGLLKNYPLRIRSTYFSWILRSKCRKYGSESRNIGQSKPKRTISQQKARGPKTSETYTINK
jgi:hypothetical protein